MASGDLNVQNSRSISGRPPRAIVAAAPALLASLALHGAGTTSQIDGTTGAQAKLLAARKGLGVEDGWRDSDRCGDLQRHNIPVGAMRKYCLFSFAGISHQRAISGPTRPALNAVPATARARINRMDRRFFVRLWRRVSEIDSWTDGTYI
jgi:hypothetical protein